MEKISDVEALSRYITDEIFRVFKQSSTSWARRTFGPLFRLPAYRFAQVACKFDHYVAQHGWREAAVRILPVFTRNYEAVNVENIPREGPLLIISNHPGTCDSLVISANVPRPDLKIVATGVPFMRSLSNAADHLIYTGKDTFQQMMVVRSAIRYLKEGGAVLIFPTGTIDPDPELSPTASNELGKWSPSIELMLKYAPQTRVLLTVVSGVLSSHWRWNPVVRLMGDEHKQRSVAEFLQVIQQMLIPNSINVSPRVTFSNPLTTADLSNDGGGMLDGMIERARCLMEDHMTKGKKLLPAKA